jgi:hypothetical protein
MPPPLSLLLTCPRHNVNNQVQLLIENGNIPQAETSSLPDAKTTEMDFLDSSFFKTHPENPLPSPAEVAARSKDFSKHRPAPVKFDDLNLIVKFGCRVVVEEAISMRMLRKILADKVPIPEVYGCKVDGDYVFIYMELIQGESLYNRWDYLSDLDRESICHELRDIVLSIRQVEQDPIDPFIGTCVLIDR